MNQKDPWILGLLVLAYLCLDSISPPRSMTDDAQTPAPRPADEDSLDSSRLLPVPVARALPVKVTPSDVCPRNPLHRVALRADGAMWCRGCDEAFYPQFAIWNSVGGAVAA